MHWLRAVDVVRRLDDGERTFEVRIAALSLTAGSRKALLGVSGSGKTTAMDALALASTPKVAGSFAIGDAVGMVEDVGALLAENRQGRLADLRARLFGYVLQTNVLLPFLTVIENVELPQRLARRRDPGLARSILSEMGVPTGARTMPGDLSVGQRQRAAIARALAHRPAFLLADEPTAALDPSSARRVLGVCLDIAAAQDMAVLIVTHDRALAEELDFEILPVKPEGPEGDLRSVIDDGSSAPGLRSES